MADFTSRTVTVTRHEWVVPAAEPWGAHQDEIGKAWSNAQRAYAAAREAADRGTSRVTTELCFHVTDDEIVIAFMTEGQA